MTQNDPDRADDKREWARSLGLLTAIVADLLGTTGAGVALGWLAWKKLGWPWWVLMVSTALGLTAGMYRLYVMSKKEWNG